METIYDFVVETNKGVTYKLDAYKGDVMLIVNTASECGFTSQFEGLQSLYEKYKDQGFVILGFPCNQLRTVEEHRERYRNKRNQNQVFQVALVGYTNAGKSSWFNVLANEETYEKDQLFATLDPKTRQIQINDGFNLIISDTVGFIQKLPTTLIAAFKSTLEEAKGADLLVHVVDSSHPEYRTQYDTVNDLIKQLDMSHISQIVIFNKKDLCDHASNRPASDLPNVFVSSKNDGDKLLVKTLFIDEIKRQLTYYDETIATNNADRLYFLKQHTLVTELKYDEIENVYRIKGFKK